MTLLKVGATYLGGFFLVPIRTGVVRDLRNQLNAKILALPLGFFSEERKGDVLARITGDVGEVENSVMSSLDLLLKNPILIFVYLGSMLVISWQLTLFVFLVLPIAGFVMGRVGKSLKRTSLERRTSGGSSSVRSRRHSAGCVSSRPSPRRSSSISASVTPTRSTARRSSV